ncbi:PAS domain-containing protein [Corallococcus sp. M34]|uniref:PAS domain-containing protein n=1 Tax=Citreicoccus inhibens TaxID=2849499 RepID=UPI001C24FCEE|nr:PAS domain-containing protein [Citreicoccus inhibens]MBU8900095.1 PAS domain-containing protein [Citreicoccus inhibens]
MPLLLVDDCIARSRALEDVLAPLGRPMVKVRSVDAALDALELTTFAAILLSVDLPGTNEREALARLQRHARGAETSILLHATSPQDANRMAEGYAAGAVDYLVEPMPPELLRARVQVFTAMHQRRVAVARREAAVLQREQAAPPPDAPGCPTQDLDDLTETVPLGMALFDRQLHYLHLNALLACAHGVDPEAARARSAWDVAPTLAPLLRERVERVWATGAPLLGMATTLPAPGGRGPSREFLFNYYPVKGNDGAVVAVGAIALDVTEQTLARQHVEQLNASLADQQQWLESILDRLPVPLILVEPGTARMTFANAAADQLWGGRFPKAASREEHARTFSVTDTRGFPVPVEQMPSIRAAQGEHVSQEQLELSTPRGRTSILVDSARVPAVGALPSTCVVTFQDISPLKMVERALEKREQEYRMLADAMPQIVWTARADGHIDYINQVFATFIGGSVETALGTSWVDVLHPDDVPGAVEAWRHSVETGAPYETEFRIADKDGDYRWFLTRATHMPDELGRPAKWFGTSTDIDATKRSKDRNRFLAEASAVLGQSFNPEVTLDQLVQLTVPTLADACAVDVLDEGGTIRRLALAHVEPQRTLEAWELTRRYPLNPQAARGIPQVLRTGRSDWVADIGLLQMDASTEPAQRHFIEKLGLKSYLVVPLVARGKVLGALTLVYANSGRRYTESDLQTAEDLARRAALAVDNARLYAASQQAVQLRDEFLSVASHELKTPLTPIQLKVQALQRRIAAEPAGVLPARQVAEVLDAVAGQARKLSSLVNGLLDVSRISLGRLELNLEQVDLAMVVHEVLATFANEAAKTGSSLELRAEGHAMGWWDRLRLEQVVTNLLSNAVKYGAGRPVKVCVETTESTALLTVRDEGIGVPTEAQRRIFEKFERAVSDRHYGGLGLGLYITRQVVEALGGTVRVESAPGRGALFSVSLPRQGPPTQSRSA